MKSCTRRLTFNTGRSSLQLVGAMTAPTVAPTIAPCMLSLTKDADELESLLTAVDRLTCEAVVADVEVDGTGGTAT